MIQVNHRESKPLNDENIFTWMSKDIEYYLPKGWKKSIESLALNQCIEKIIVPTSVTSREDSSVTEIITKVVGGKKLKSELPWLYELYANKFRLMSEEIYKTEVFIAEDDRYAINLNVQIGNKARYECHVDSNPIEGLLYVTDHPKGQGGELIVSNEPSAIGCQEIDRDCVRIYPRTGDLIFFNASNHPHYVAPLTSEQSIRIVVAMNYYTWELTEKMRPADLNHHLGIE